MTAATDHPKSAGNYRWAICALLFFSVAVNYIDRLVIGILKAPLSEALGWTLLHVDKADIAPGSQRFRTRLVTVFVATEAHLV